MSSMTLRRFSIELIVSVDLLLLLLLLFSLLLLRCTVDDDDDTVVDDGLVFGLFEYLQSTFALIQPLHGFSPLHFVFFRRHSPQALITLSLLRLVLSIGI
jgi:hypothetical protein